MDGVTYIINLMGQHIMGLEQEIVRLREENETMARRLAEAQIPPADDD